MSASSIARQTSMSLLETTKTCKNHPAHRTKVKVKQRKHKIGNRHSKFKEKQDRVKIVIKYALNIFLIWVIIIKFNAYLIHVVIK